jgi:hypothetical protein
MNRTLLLGTAWTASAGAAVGLGFLAVSLVDASASPAVQPVASSALESGESTSAAPSPSASPAPTGQQNTVGGTVFASCAGGSTVPVLSGAPAAGWWPDDSQKPGQFEFKSATQSIEVNVTCVGGVPQFAVEGPRADDNNRGGDDNGGGTPAAPSSSDAPDDSDGRVGGGHGADDGPGHDAGDDHGGGSNSGSGSSGGGSDDSGSGGSGGHGSDD